MDLFLRKYVVAIWLYAFCSLSVMAVYDNDTSKYATANKIDKAIQNSKSLNNKTTKPVIPPASTQSSKPNTTTSSAANTAAQTKPGTTKVEERIDLADLSIPNQNIIFAKLGLS